MAKEKFDGKSRPSNDLYRKRFDEIFGKKEKIYPENAFAKGIRKQMEKEKTLHEELMEGFKKEQEELNNEEE